VVEVTDEALATVYDPYWIATISGRADAPQVRWLRDLLLPRLNAVARQFGADHVATGHFARNVKGVQRYHDAALDQSPAFATCAPEDLARLLLPIGEVSPEMVVRLGVELGALAKPEGEASAATAKEALEADRNARGNWSWGLLLKSPEVQARAALDVFKPGPYRGSDELALGEHEGIPMASIGDPVPGHFGQFVVEILPQTLTIRVGPEAMLEVDRAFLKDVSWVDSEERGYAPRKVSAEAIPFAPKTLSRPRPRVPAVTATVLEYPARLAELRFALPLRTLAPGQTIVFSSDSRILGSGTVVETLREPAMRTELEPLSKAE
jgi:tRNA-specific 2-thiouridylase